MIWKFIVAVCVVAAFVMVIMACCAAAGEYDEWENGRDN